MIEVKVDKNEVNRILNTLQSMDKKAPSLLKKAVNDTAKEARKKLADKAKETYAVKQSGFNKSMTIKSATIGNLEAIIKTQGKSLELGEFRVSPFRYTTGRNRPPYVKAKRLNASPMEKMITSNEKYGDIKAFVARFKNGHIALVERKPPKKMKYDEKKDFIKKLWGPSIPQMIGNETKVYGAIEPEIQEMLRENIQRNIIAFLKKGIQ